MRESLIKAVNKYAPGDICDGQPFTALCIAGDADTTLAPAVLYLLELQDCGIIEKIYNGSIIEQYRFVRGGGECIAKACDCAVGQAQG